MDENIKHNMKTNYKWFILGVGVLAQVVFSLGFTGIAVSGINFRNVYGFSLSQIGMILGAIGLGVGVSEFLWGLATDKFGDKKVLTFGLFSMGSVYLFIAFYLLLKTDHSINYLYLSFLLFLVGLVGGSINSSSGKTIIAWFPDGERGFAMSIRQTAIPLGGSIGTILIPWLAEHYNFSSSFFFLSGFSIITSIIILSFVNEKDPLKHQKKLEKINDLEKINLSPLNNIKVWRMVLTAGLLTIPQMAIISFGAIYLRDHLNINLVYSSILLILVQVLGATIRIYLGKSTDINNNRIKIIINIATICSILCLLLVITTNNTFLSIIVLVAIGISSNSWHGIGFAEAAIQAGENRSGTALGMMGTTVFLFSFLTPLIISSILKNSNWSIVWCSISILTALTIPILIFTSYRISKTSEV